ncbi:MAG TPA: hypothetical protein VG245_10070 [Candidatus Dormibacteraeota bacterium]|nr:hypothetical protein [Candidatus Dormibacteraeota bacterium]
MADRGPGPVPPPYPGPFGNPGGNRQLLFLMVAGAVLVTLALLFFTFLGAVYMVRGGRVSGGQAPAKLPPEVVTCAHFSTTQSSVATTDTGAMRYDVQGECPINPLALNDVYIADLEYHGWTVHSDDQGGILAYAYGRKEQLTATLTESSVDPNQTTLQVEMLTGVSQPPPDFPSPR